MSFSLAASMASSKRVGRFYVPQGYGGGVTPLPEIGYDTTHIAGGGSITRGVANPLGPGLVVYRELPADGGISERAEDFLTGYYSPYFSRMNIGDPFLWAGAVYMRPGYGVSRGVGGDNTMLVAQTHTNANGDTTPDLSFEFCGQGSPLMRWRSAYNQHPSSTWLYNYVSGDGPYQDTTASPVIHSEAMIPEGQWYYWVVRMVPAWQASDNPRLDIWRSINGAAWGQIVNNYTGLNTYNVTGSGLQASYPRVGPYKWEGSVAEPNALGFYTTPCYFGRESAGWGLANAQAALEPWMA